MPNTSSFDPLESGSDVLVVSSDRRRRAALKSLVQACGMEAHAPPRPRMALSRLRYVDLICVDLSSGDEESRELCREIKRRDPGLPIIALLPDGESSPAEVLELGVDDFALFPCAAEELAARLRTRLRERGDRMRSADAVAQHRALVDSAHAGLYVVQDGRFTYVNQQFARLFGYTAHEIHPLATLHDFVAEDERLSVGARFTEWAEGDAPAFRCTFRGVRKGGRTVHVELHATRATIGGRPAVIGTVLDVSRRMQAQEAQHRGQEYFRVLIERAQDIITVVDQEGLVLYESPSVESVLGYTPEELVGRNVFELIHRDDAAQARAVMDRMRQTPGLALSTRCRFRNKAGEWRVLEATGRDLLDHPTIEGFVINARDVTEQQAAEDALRHAAFTDPLTGLPNRALFADRLSRADARTRRHPGRKCAVLFLDLDRFKVVNDSLGHAVGDRLLVAVARRLQLHLRPEDTVARVGGDEFAVLLEEVEGPQHCIRVAQRVLEAIAAPFDLGEYEVFTSASVGIVLNSSGSDDIEHLLRNADVAMYRAKAAGGAGYEIFDRAMHTEVVHRLQMETDLRHALERGEFHLQFQPIVELASGRAAGLEALIRWKHPKRGTIPPASFIGIAEETGRIVEIGGWVIEVACQHLRDWQERTQNPDLFVAVNLSSRQLHQPDLAARVGAALQAAGLTGRSLKLEITESMVVDNTDQVTRVLRQLKDLGVQLFMDDFGTGFASLSYLHRLPIDGIKIDRSFVSPMHSDPRHAVLVESTVALAQGLALAVVAEGVELAEHAERLHELGCDFGQGFHFARPLDASRVGRYLDRACGVVPAPGASRTKR